MLLIAFVVVGPQDLPKVARWLARMLKRCRSLLSQIKAESGWNELERELSNTKGSIDRELRELKQNTDITQDIHEGTDEIQHELDNINKEAI